MAKSDQQDQGADVKQDAGAADEAGVATEAQNDRLDHSRGGVTTRDDATDLGVPMLPGSPGEPVGPEDALGPGPKRGDYSGRVGPAEYHPMEVVPDPDSDPSDPTTANVKVVYQRDRVADVGDEAGKKGGVETV